MEDPIKFKRAPRVVPKIDPQETYELLYQEAEEGKCEMIKFTCDSCGKDMSDKVFSSVRQFYGKGYFEGNISEQVMEDRNNRFPDVHDGLQQEHEGVHLGVKLFHEFLKMIHAFAWDVSPTCMFCSTCAMKHANMKKKKVVTIFTRIEERPYNN